MIYGQAGTTRTVLDMGSLATSDGFALVGDGVGDQAGRSVSSAGDINGDGIDDLIVGVPNSDNSGSNAGEAYVIYGQIGASRGALDLDNLASSDGFNILGDSAGDYAGISVSNAGDVNGDGINDMIVGATADDTGGTGAGAAYVIFGQAGTTRGTVDLSGLLGANGVEGFKIQGDVAGDVLGKSVSGGRDVNGDGIDDVIIGASGGDDGGALAGEAYVIYGRRPTDSVTRTGTDLNQTILGGNLDDTIDGGGGNDVLDGGGGADDLIGGSGKDMAAYRQADAGVTLSLDTGLGTGGEAAGDTFTSVERARGSDFGDDIDGDGAANVLRGEGGNDVLKGKGGNDRIRGGEGADNLNGGGGQDWLDYSDSGEGVIVNLTTGATSGGTASGDTVTAIEKIEGSEFGDWLTGSAGVNTIRGGAGGDIMFGGDGLDWLDYGGSDAGVTANLTTGMASGGHGEGDVIFGFEHLLGSDFGDMLTGTDDKNNIYGQDGDDTIIAGDGTDRVRGGAGADSMDGGDGRDWLDYRGSDGAIDIDLSTNSASGGDATGDIITGFERIYGSDFADTLTGDGERNQVRGGDGNDTIDGGADNDKLFGEDDDDTFIFSGGRDTIDGGADDDELIMTGDQADFTVVTSGAITTVTEIATGDLVEVKAVETLVFDDGNVIL